MLPSVGGVFCSTNGLSAALPAAADLGLTILRSAESAPSPHWFEVSTFPPAGDSFLSSWQFIPLKTPTHPITSVGRSQESMGINVDPPSVPNMGEPRGTSHPFVELAHNTGHLG